MAVLKSFRPKEEGFFSIDALFAIILLLLTLTTLVSLYQGRRSMVRATRERLEGEMIVQKLAGAVNVVHAGGEPLTLNIHLKENIGGKNYTVQFDEGEREISIRFIGDGQNYPVAEASVVVDQLDLSGLENVARKIRICWENDNIIKVKNP
ncbi:hypothetical protein AKJ65_03420 [candidate division MSBL1 archaeon SCGC-AAA259E19]|uniref:Uncharacterized protein n=2 Tax=candidate division MSBL1 TaxID=215777 RepID=A0A133V4U3_9EURY|nr:hypothetical protein AKJ65_03420 [candidate division MSBL1 archaeon SCGC-AAA259E19]KXB01441.1 hypothetical protein AKJ41_01480 [candidate division MSBL1 archaeon SCGC-AAA259O05]